MHVNSPNRLSVIKSWTLVACWMIVIFSFSTERFSSAQTVPVMSSVLPHLFPGLTADQIEAANLIARKLGHFSEYFVLAILLRRAFLVSDATKSIESSAWRAVLAAFVFALSDEWHQSFVPGRTASLLDVALDTFGAICGVLFMLLSERGRKNAKQSVTSTN